MFDDEFSLAGLADVVDFQTALSYLIGNNTGPTGRPVSMLSFLVNVNDWDENPSGFRQINALIHLANIILVAIVAWRIVRQIPALTTRANGVALSLALLWGAHPLLASSVLSVVQRMTLLSGFFVLLGILGYLIGRQRAETMPRMGMAIMLGSLFICTLLAGFSKENGFLLPAFAGLIEILVLARQRPLQLPRARWIGPALLWVPILVFALYVIWNWAGISAQDYRRDFTWDQRLWSQALILIDYVRQIFIPDIRMLGPFQDDPEKLAGLSLWSALAVVAWIIALAGAVWKRKTHPILLFGLSWFLIGHLLESSFIQLELYFEHRNYIPMLGLLAIPVTIAWHAEPRWPRVILIGLYLPAMVVLLVLTLRGWANPEIGAERWSRAHPKSLRALTYQARWILHTQGGAAAAEMTLAAANRDSDNLEKAAFALAAQCELKPSPYGPGLLRHIQRTLETSRPSVTFLSYLEHAMTRRLKGECDWLSLPDLERTFRVVLDQTALPNADPTAKARLLVNLGLIRMADGQVAEGLNSLVEGFRIHRTYFTYGLIVETLLTFQRTGDAEALTQEFIAYQPSNILGRHDHQRRVMAAYEAARARADTNRNGRDGAQ